MRRWLTPEAATGDYSCRRFSIPVEMLSIVMGTLQPLIYADNYEPDGTMTPLEASELMRVMLNTYTTSEGECNMFMGMVFPSTTVPLGINDVWLLCDNGTHLKSDYPQYWQFLVDTSHDSYWEVDATHFKTPDLRERFIFGTDADIGLEGGEASHVLTIAEMPAHTHAEQDPGSTNAQAGAGAVALADPGLPSQTGSTGGGGAHNNIPPYVALYYFLRVKP